MTVLRAWEAFLAGFAAAAAVGLLTELRPRPVERRLDEVRAVRVPLRTESLLQGDGEAEPPRRWGAGFRGAAAWLFGRLQQALLRRGRSRPVEARLRQAGLSLRAAEYFGLRTLAGLGAGVLGALIWRSPLAFPAVAVAAFFLPELEVERRVRRRRRAFVEQLPDGLAAIANSLRSGFSFLQAVEVAAQELPEPAASELLQMVRETQVDIAVEDALANLYARLPLPEVQLVVTAVLIQRQVGGNLAGLLEQVADTVRLRLRLERELRALTAQGRLSGWIVGLLPVGLGAFLGLVNPTYVGTLFHDALGQVLLVGAAVLQAVGVLIIRRLVRLEV